MSQERSLKVLTGLVAFLWACLVFIGMLVVGSLSSVHVPLFSPKAIKMGILALSGALMGLLASRLPLSTILRWSSTIHWLMVGLVGAVFAFGVVSHGARRWLMIGGFSLQPSELVKVTLILLGAYLLAFREGDRLSRWLSFSVGFLVPGLLILAQPDLGTTIVLYFVYAVMCYVYGFNPLIILGVTLAGGAIGFRFLKDYQVKRLLTFLDPYHDPYGAGWNVIQSMNAIGSGGLTGKGMGMGALNRLGFVPENSTDFIMALIGEEWGFIGVGLVLMLELGLIVALMALALRGGRRAKLTPARLFAVGMASLLFMHVLENSAMCVSLMPVTGLTMPFISYGGTSAMTFSLGVWLAITLNLKEEELLLS